MSVCFSCVFYCMPAAEMNLPIKTVWVILSYRQICGISNFRLHTLMAKFMTSLMAFRLTPAPPLFIPFQLPPLMPPSFTVQR